MTGPVLELAAVVKNYRGLRPLRIERLALRAGDHVALVGVDQVTAEVLINLITGAVLPDQGEIRAFDRSTADIADGDAWLAAADRFGIVSERAVLLDALSVVQNLSMPFSLEIEPPAPDVERQAQALAEEVGLVPADRDRRVAELDPLARARVRLARALAFDPAVLLVEHPSAGLPRGDVVDLARRIRRVAEGRGVAVLTLTADREFAAEVASRVLTLDAATGRLRETRRGWFRGRG